MYLWKYWRESRITFGVTVLVLAILLALILRSNLQVGHGNPNPNQLSGIVYVLVIAQSIPLGFVAWLFGSFGVGRDLGESSGSYLLTRPRRRAFFVWSDWGYGMAQLLTIVILTNAVLGVLVSRLLDAMGNPIPGRIVLFGTPVPIPLAMVLSGLGGLLLVALIFSLTYFCTVLVKHSKGVMLAAGVLLGYSILKAVVKHYWPQIELPSLILQSFEEFTPQSLITAVALRTAVILAFPFAAQLLLEKTDL